MKIKKGFTLIELLVTISIIAVLAGIGLFATQGVREQGRNAKRKADLETLRSGLELYRSDCNGYPVTAGFVLSSATTLVGDNTPASCAASNTYISQVPKDPQSPGSQYYYNSNGSTYTLCARLENETGATVDASCGSNCGSGGACSWSVKSP